MTEEAIKQGLNDYFNSLVSNTREEVSPSRAVSNISIGGFDKALKSLSPKIDREITRIERDIDEQVEEFLKYFEDDLDKQNFLDTNPIYSNIPNKRVAEGAEEDLIKILAQTRNNLEVVYQEDADNFYSAIAENYEKEEGIELLNDTFSQIDVLQPYFDRMEIDVELDLGLFSKEIDITDEITHSMLVGEEYTRQKIVSKLESSYD